MTTAFVYALCGATLIGIGVFGLVWHVHLLRRIVAYNITGSGVFLTFGALGSRLADRGADPVPQAMVITGIVVALAATAVAVTLIVRLLEETGRTTLPDEDMADDTGSD